MAHQSTVYYERCYTADLDPTISPSQKEACWTAWLQYYAVAQPPHRVRYAQSREIALRAGETLPPMVGMPVDLWDETQSATFLSGVTVYETHPERPAVEARELVRSPPSDVASSSCYGVCEPGWERCLDACGTTDESETRACVNACQTEFRTCARACP